MATFPKITVPEFYQSANLVSSAYNPSYYHVENTYLQRYFRRYLLEKAMSVFKFELPDNWDTNYTMLTLFLNGFMGVFYAKEYGVIPQFGTIHGYDLYYRPTKFLCVNPYLKEQYNELEIGKDCVLVKMTPEYIGVLDLINYYADQMALLAETHGVNLFTARVGYVAVAGNKAAAESLKAAYDEMAGGNPFVVVDKELLSEDGTVPWEWFSQNLKQNYLSSDILLDMCKVETMFDADIGLPNANTEKRERLITDEVNANNESTRSKSELWLENIQAGFKEVEKMFGVKATVKRRFDYDEKESASVNNDTVSA